MNVSLNIFKFGFDIVLYVFGIIAIIWIFVNEIKTKQSIKWAEGNVIKKLLVFIIYIFFVVAVIFVVPNTFQVVKSYILDIPCLIKGEFLYIEGYPTEIYDEGGKFSDDVIIINGMELRAASGIPRKYKANYKFVIEYLPNTQKIIKIKLFED